MPGYRRKAVVLTAYAKAMVALKTAIYAADGDIFDVDFAQVRNRWLAHLSLVERRAVQDYENATTPAGLESLAPEAIALLHRLGCEINQNASASTPRNGHIE